MDDLSDLQGALSLLREVGVVPWGEVTKDESLGTFPLSGCSQRGSERMA